LAAARALEAGADLLLLNNGYHLPRATIVHLAAKIRSGAIPMERLDQAVRRVLLAKEHFGMWHPEAAGQDAATALCAAPGHQALVKKMSANAVTVIRDATALLPLRVGESTLVVAPPAAYKFAVAIGGVESRISDQPTESEFRAVRSAIKENPNRTVIVLLAGAALFQEQRRLAQEIVGVRAPVIIVALRHPYDLLPFVSGSGQRQSPTLIATYGASPDTLAALAAILRGDKKPAGRLPVELSKFIPLGTGLTDFSKN
jgi:hypothetical protein